MDYEILDQIGKGSYGVIYKIRHNSQIKVLKEIPLKNLSLKQQNEAYKEVQIMNTLNHPNIVSYYNSNLRHQHLQILMECCDDDLHNYIQRNPQPSEPQIWQWITQLLEGLDYLHQQKIIHRDIKPNNILIKSNVLKIGDMGVSKIQISQMLLSTRVGTPLYLAPELIRNRPYDSKVDIWALGCVLYYICQGEPPFCGSNLISLGYNIVNKSPKPINSKYSRKLQSLIFRLLNKVPEFRPSAQQALQLMNEDVKPLHSRVLSLHTTEVDLKDYHKTQQMLQSRRVERIIQQQRDAQQRVCEADKFSKIVLLNRIIKHKSEHYAH